MARTDSFLLLTGDYASRLDKLYSAAMQAKDDAEKERGEPRRLGEDPVEELSAQYEALRAEAEAAGIRVTLRDLTRPEWKQLKADHPPRVDGDPEAQKADRIAGFNSDEAEDDLVYGSLLRVTEAGETTEWRDESGKPLRSRAAFDEWFNGLSHADSAAVVSRAWQHNNFARVDPKSLGSSATRTTDAS